MHGLDSVAPPADFLVLQLVTVEWLKQADGRNSVLHLMDYADL